MTTPAQPPTLSRRMLLFGSAGLALPASPVRAQQTGEPFFLRHNPIWKDIDLRGGRNPVEAQFGVHTRQMDALIRSVLHRMQGLGVQQLPSRTVEVVAKAIQREVDGVVQGSGTKLNEFARQWLLAEGVCRWVFENVFYDHRQIGADGRATDFARLGKPEVILAGNPPGALCGGFACLIRDLARAAGLRSYKVDGHSRELGTTGPVPQNHSIACFEFPGGLKVPADLASGSYRSIPRDGPRVFRPIPPVRINEAWTLPRRPEAWEIFLARFCTWDGLINGKKIVNWDGDLQGVHYFHDLPLKDWQTRDTSHLKPLLQWMWRLQDAEIATFGGRP